MSRVGAFLGVDACDASSHASGERSSLTQVIGCAAKQEVKLRPASLLAMPRGNTRAEREGHTPVNLRNNSLFPQPQPALTATQAQ